MEGGRQQGEAPTPLQLARCMLHAGALLAQRPGPLGSCLGPGGSLPAPGPQVSPWGQLGKGMPGGGSKSQLPGVADFVSPSAVLVPGFSLILHGSSTGSCDL